MSKEVIRMDSIYVIKASTLHSSTVLVMMG